MAAMREAWLAVLTAGRLKESTITRFRTTTPSFNNTQIYCQD